MRNLIPVVVGVSCVTFSFSILHMFPLNVIPAIAGGLLIGYVASGVFDED